jgi:hypothetical protein
MRKLFYCGLEAYQDRYTLQLTSWNTAVFDRRGIDYTIVLGNDLTTTKNIQVGQVLDAHGRGYYSLSQMMSLIKLMKEGDITGEDVIFFEDMFTPGIEALPYILNQIPTKDRPQIWLRCLAQTVDPDDFVHSCNMSDWMRKYEQMVNCFATGILASNEEMIANMRVAGWTAPVYNISGLAFDANEVRSRANARPFDDRQHRVVFASRWDREKQPDFFMDIVEGYHQIDPSVEFCLLQGSVLRSNNQKYIARARDLEQRGLLTICDNLSKNQYYQILANSKVLLNTALQDWTSNTVSEADALGCNVLFPAYRSFPEILNNDATRLYVPWSKTDVYQKLGALLDAPHEKISEVSAWTSGTVDRYLDIMTGSGAKWNRDSVDYRDLATKDKY